MKGMFITFEGTDGSGKTTVIKEITERLLKSNIDFITTREPGGIDIAEQIRSVILNKDNTSMDPRTEALLYAASRRQHLVEKVLPALNDNKIVICDRFVDSSLVYQGHARGIGIEEVYSINKFAIDNIMPDFTIYLDCDPMVGLSRIAKSNERVADRLDLEPSEFHLKVYKGYEIIKQKYNDRIVTIDANRDIEDVVNDVYKVILSKLKDD